MMEKVQHSSNGYFVQIRMTLILIAIVSFPFNLIGIFTENARAGSINQIVALSSSGLSAIVWLYWYRGNAALSKATAGAIINDLFFAIYLSVVYFTVIIISEGVREHVIFVYGNLACLISSLFHALAVLMAATYRYKAYLARVSQPKNITTRLTTTGITQACQHADIHEISCLTLIARQLGGRIGIYTFSLQVAFALLPDNWVYDVYR
ncbi:hypothetical protein BDV41DRAFT_552543 [Aspergillus transmontanensis]|uniref:Uncharacterized protein n=1 Tax=Aspergillus transmontanensis TaxID=1034304 RepID=A0A5N6VHT2_9EURO|nr:hypothetical protein BDV41DRAFT_552543 [Aspergillus transmontanensis]